MTGQELRGRSESLWPFLHAASLLAPQVNRYCVLRVAA